MTSAATAIDHNCRPGDLPLPPRRLQRRPGRGCGPLAESWLLRLFILPHTIIGIGAIAAALFSVFVWLFGADVPGRITKLDITPGKKGDYYYVHYAYTVDGIEYANTTTVSSDIYGSLRVGQAYDARVFRPVPTWMPLPRGPGSSASTLLGLLFFALFWNGLLSIGLWMAWVAPWRPWLLLRHGLATAGAVLGKEVRRGNKGATSHVVRYGYAATVAEEGSLAGRRETFEREMNITPEDYVSVTVGQPVTVIYRARKPKRSLIYEFADYEAVDSCASC